MTAIFTPAFFVLVNKLYCVILNAATIETCQMMY